MNEQNLGKKLRRIIESNKEGTSDPTGAFSVAERLSGLIMFARPETDAKYQRVALGRWCKDEFETIEELRQAIKQLILELVDELPWLYWKAYFRYIYMTYLAEDAPLADKW